MELITDEETLTESLKKRLEVEIGMPLDPRSAKQIDTEFKDNVILTNFFPISEINTLKIDNECVPCSKYTVSEDEGIIYLNEVMAGTLYLEYTYALPEEEYIGLLNMMMEYETDTNPYTNATSVREENVSVSYDSSTTKGALIQSLITDLRTRYNCLVRMM